MSDELRGSEPVLNTKEAILEIRGDVKLLLAFMSEIVATNLPKRMEEAEDAISSLRTDVEAERAWRRGLAAAAAVLGTILVALQVIAVLNP